MESLFPRSERAETPGRIIRAAAEPHRAPAGVPLELNLEDVQSLAERILREARAQRRPARTGLE